MRSSGGCGQCQLARSRPAVRPARAGARVLNGPSRAKRKAMIMTPKKRVLIIDDETGFTRLLKLNLQLIGKYTVEVVNDPARALTVAGEFQPDVILLDVMMPSMDGGEVATKLHAHSRLRHTPIVFLTAAVKRSEVQCHEGQIGGLPFIAKPVDLQEVIDSIESHTPAWNGIQHPSP